MPIEPQAANHQAVEMAQQKVGEVEGSRLGLGKRGERKGGGEELVAMGARNAFNPLLAQHPFQQPAGAAVAVGDEDRIIAFARGANEGANGGGNLFGPVVQLGRQAAHVDLVPAIGTAQCRDLVRQRPTGDDQQPRAPPRNFLSHCTAQWAAAPARRAAISPLAVSTATAASRQYASAPTALPNSSLSGAPPTSTM